MICEFDDRQTCRRCGYMRPFEMRRKCPGRPGLGTRVAAGLAAVGITKDRAQAVANAVGIKDCGCREREAALNRAGYRLGIGTPPPPDSGPTG